MSQSNDLFHASCKLYEVGTILKRDKPTMYSIQQRKIGNGWIDEKLNEIKPRNAPLKRFYLLCM
ncbi:MAG: hypothetical protein IPJ26_15395 [Bacteroidetes bacterium]|nr:hypothetical protein [Bacteroidota bacterium]